MLFLFNSLKKPKMKKLFKLLTVAIMLAVVAVSCNKKEDTIMPQKVYAQSIAGQFIAQDGDITLKSAPVTPLVGGHQFNCYDQKTTGAAWTPVDGSEFLPGSAPQLDWAPYTIDGSPWWFAGDVRITYCPILPMRVVLKATKGGYGTEVSYLGIWEGTPNQASFPITIQDRRLGDVLTLNTDELTALPGYSSISFSVSYDKAKIDLPGTIATSPVTTTGWPIYVYGATTNVTNQTMSSVIGVGEQTVYEGLDSKILGTITITIIVDGGVPIIKTVGASAIGHGMRIILKTTKVGWYDSGTIVIHENDITADLVNIII